MPVGAGVTDLDNRYGGVIRIRKMPAGAGEREA